MRTASEATPQNSRSDAAAISASVLGNGQTFADLSSQSDSASQGVSGNDAEQPNAENAPLREHIRPVDQTVLELLGRHRPAVTASTGTHSPAGVGMTVPDLTDQLEVTPTAVRQRLERLTSLKLIERTKESVGRGRPQYRYRLTTLGKRYASASYADLATALWQELLDLPNPRQRIRVLQRVAERMGRGLKSAIPETANIHERVSAAAAALGRRKVVAEVKAHGELPVLEVQTCPYPDLAENDESRQLCELEQKMLSEAIGEEVHLDCCRLDGHESCQFKLANAESAG